MKNNIISIIRNVLIIFCFLPLMAFSQDISVEVSISPRPSPYLSDWQDRTETATLVVINETADERYVRIYTKIFRGGFSSGDLQAESDIYKMPVIMVPPGVSTFDAADILPLEAIMFYGGVDETAQRSGKLPAGNYTICVQLYDAEMFEPITEDKCVLFNITDYQPPTLLRPADGTEMDLIETEGMIFRWTPVMPSPIEGTLYRIAVFEVLEGQDPMTAFQSNFPVMETEVYNRTQLIWPADFDGPRDNMQYVWSVQAIDEAGNTLGEPDGWAEPYTFSVGTEGQCQCNEEGRFEIIVIQEEGINELRGGQTIEFIAEQDFCPEDCGPERENRWELLYVSEDGFSESYFGESTEFEFSVPEGPGKLSVNYSGMVYCNGVPCEGINEASKEYDVMPKEDDITAGEIDCIITPISPIGSCVGQISNNLTSASVPVSWRASQSINEFIVVVYDNPCGQYKIPPETPGGRDRITPGSGGGSDDLIKKIRELEGIKVKTSGYQPVSGERIWTSPPITSTPSSDIGDIPNIHEYELPVSDIIELGAAFIYQIEGICLTPDGEEIQVYSEPQCSRYLPVDEEIGIPVEKLPCDSVPPSYFACKPLKTVKPADAISLGMYVEEPKLFQYPRAVPIRADAIDWDQVIFECLPGKYCPEKGSRILKAVRDHIEPGDIKWKLDGKGSLNESLDIDAFNNVQQQINDKNAQIEDLLEKIDSLKTARDNKMDYLKARMSSAESSLNPDSGNTGINDDIKTLEDKISNYQDTLKTSRDELNTLIKNKEDLTTRIGEVKDSIQTVLPDSINVYEQLLLNEPTENELKLLGDVQNAKKDVDKHEEAVKNGLKKVSDESQKLQESVTEKAGEVREAEKDYIALTKQAEDNTRRIASLQTQVYKLNTPFANISRDYLRKRREFNRIASTFIRNYFGNDQTRQQKLEDLQAGIDDQANKILAANITGNKYDHLSIFDSLRTVFFDLADNGCDNYTDTNFRSACHSTRLLTRSSSDLLRQTLNNAIKVNFSIDTANQSEIERLQRILSGLEYDINKAEQEIESASSEYKTAQENYANGIERLENEQKQKVELLEQKKNDLSAIEKEYQDTLKQRNTKFENLRSSFVLKKSYFDSLRTTKIILRENLTDSLSTVLKDSSDKKIYIAKLKQDSSETSKELENKKDLKKQLENILKTDTASVRKEYDDKIKDLEDQIKDLEKELADLKQQQQQTTSGNKSATGTTVYYIPPPLEEIMKNKPRFEELKDSVAASETELKAAKDHKAAAQKRLLQKFESIARSLVRYAKAGKALEDLKKQKEDLDEEGGEDLEKSENEEALEGIQSTADSSLSIAEAKLSELDPDAIMTEIKTIQQNIADKIVEISAKIAELQKQKNLQAKTLKQLTEARNQLVETTIKLESSQSEREYLERQQEQIKGDITRSAASENPVVAARSEAQLEVVNSKIMAQISKVVNTRSELALIANKHQNFANTASEQDSLLAVKFQELGKDLADMSELFEDLYDKNREFEQTKKQVNHWQYTKIRAEKLKSKTQNAKETLDSLSKQKENQEKEESRDLSDEIKKLEDTKTKAGTDIKQALKDKEEILKKADERIDNAEKNLEKAEKDLRDFIVNEFNTVTHKVKIRIEVEDKVIDGFRADDKKEILVKELSYNGSRLPLFQNSYPESKPKNASDSGDCQVILSLIKDPEINVTHDPKINTKEPRTIALIYKNGEPLWPEWPVIPAGAPVLSKDVVITNTEATDIDVVKMRCESGSCDTKPPLSFNPVDLIQYSWGGNGRFIVPGKNANPELDMFALWEPPDVPKIFCEKDFDLKGYYNASGIVADDTKEKLSKPLIKPGVLIEIPDSVVAAPKEKKKLRVRLVKGDHTGLQGEDVMFALKTVAGEAKNYGFDGSDSLTVKQTNGSGYAETEFNFGEGFARWDITVKWLRNNRKDTCETRVFRVESPLHLQMLKVSSGVPAIAWNKTEEIWDGGNIEQALEEVAGASEEELESSIYAVAGYYDFMSDFVNEEMITFKCDDRNVKIEKEDVETGLFGIAKTDIDTDVEAKFKVTAKCDEKYEEVCYPASDEETCNTEKQNEFMIGLEGKLFTVQTDEDFSPGETLNMTGKLKVSDNPLDQIVLNELLKLDLNINDVIVEESSGDGAGLVAIQGIVSWKTPEGAKINAGAFEFILDSLMLRAKAAAGMGGKIKHNSFEEPIGYEAEISPGGDFYGEISNLPAVEIASFKLRQGTGVIIDWSGIRSEANFENSYKGVVIKTASLELPQTFASAETGSPALLNVESFGINAQGVEGKVSLKEAVIKAGFAKFEFELNEISLEFKRGDILPEKAGLKGKIFPPKNIITGGFEIDVGLSGEEWSAEITTLDTLNIPNLEVDLFLADGTKVVWDKEKEIGTLILNGTLRHASFGTVEASNLKVTSDGEFDADAVRLKTDVAFVIKGFNLQISEIALVKEEELYNLEIHGNFGFPQIGVDQLSGALILRSGGVPTVRLDEAKISFKSGPCDFEGSLSFGADEFRGDFSLGIKKPKFAIDGILIVGAQSVNETENYTYWYLEANIDLGAGIPLGQALVLLRLGGGVGWNYDPPMGEIEGSPRKTEEFSFKATAGIGSQPGGFLVNSSVSLSYSSGRFAIMGRMWFLQQKDNLYGEAALVINIDRQPTMEGYVQAVAKMPDSEGSIVRFNGKINFRLQNNRFEIKSEDISGSVLDLLKAEAELLINSQTVFVAGRLYFDFHKEYSLKIISIIADIHVESGGSFRYEALTESRSRSEYPKLSAKQYFTGNWRIDMDTPIKLFNITSGSTRIKLSLLGKPNLILVQGTAHFKASFFGYGVDKDFAIGYRIPEKDD